MKALSPRGRALIDVVREVDRPTAQDRARIRAALTAQLGVAVLPAASSALSAPPPIAPSVPVPIAPPPLPAIPMLSGLGVKVVAAGALIGAIAAGGVSAGVMSFRPSGPSIAAPARPVALVAPQAVADGDRPPPPAPVTAAAPAAAPARAESEASAKPPAERARTSSPRPSAPAAAPVAPAVGGVSPSHASSLMEETALLREAQAALKDGDAVRSLAAVDALAARHPQGMLREERLAAHVLALCAAGRVEEARAEGQRFVAEMPRSIQAERVRVSCAF